MATYFHYFGEASATTLNRPTYVGHRNKTRDRFMQISNQIVPAFLSPAIFCIYQACLNCYRLTFFS